MNISEIVAGNKSIPAGLCNTDGIDEIDTENIILLILYTIILMTGSCGNLLVVCYFGRIQRKKIFNYYILNLGLADFFASSITPLQFIYTIISKQWRMGVVICKVISSIGPLTVNVSAWLVMSIAIERYRGITAPLTERIRKWKFYCLIAAIWLISGIMSIPYMHAVRVENCSCVPIWENGTHEFVYSIVVLFIQSILPIISMGVMVHTIRSTIKEQTASLHGNGKFSLATLFANNNTKRGKQERKISIMLFIALTAFVVCSLPYNIFYSTSLFLVKIKEMKSDGMLATLYQLNIWLSIIVVLNSCMNFFIYAWMDKKFNQFCKKLFKRSEKNSPTNINRINLVEMTELRSSIS